MNLLSIFTVLNFLGCVVVPLATVCGVVPATEWSMNECSRSQLEVTAICLPSFPCSAALERSDGTGAKAGGGLAGGELIDASTVPFDIVLSCA